MNARFIYSVLNTPALSKKKAFLKANGIAKPLDLFTVYHKDYLWLSQSSLECDFENDFLVDLQGELKEGRLRLEKWLKPDPAALLETGNIVLSVHHGGANCFHEAIGYACSKIHSVRTLY